jgi:hypothetical protein
MRKAAVRHGDPTTTRGFVIAVTSTIYDDGKQVALSGDEATCGTCKGAFKILGTGRGMSEKGRVIVLDGNLVLCPCKRNRVIVGANPGIFLEASGDATGARDTYAPGAPDQPAQATQHTRWFLVSDSVTGEPLTNRAFVADIGGMRHSGRTDGLGYAMIKTDGAQSVEIHIHFASPKRALTPFQGA